MYWGIGCDGNGKKYFRANINEYKKLINIRINLRSELKGLLIGDKTK